MRDMCICGVDAKYRVQVFDGRCFRTGWACDEHLGSVIAGHLEYGEEVKVWHVEPRCCICDRLASYEVEELAAYLCVEHRMVTVDVKGEKWKMPLMAKRLGE